MISLKRARKRVCSKKGYHLDSPSYSQDFSLFPEMWFKTRFSLTELEVLLMDFRGSSAWREGGGERGRSQGKRGLNIYTIYIYTSFDR